MSQTAEPSVCPEQRKSRRVKTLKKGKIIFNDGFSVVECTVCNISECGAGLRLACVVELPDVFTLHIEGGEKRECEVVWSANDKLGVSFIDPSRERQTVSPRRILLKRITSIEEQLEELRKEIETTLAP